MLELDKELQSIQCARNLIRRAKKAQAEYAQFGQERINRVVEYIAKEFVKYSEELAKLANEETGFGNWQDKVLKNVFGSMGVYDYIRDMKTVGILCEDPVNQVMDVGVPLGIISALVPSTNPTSTIIFKTLVALKAGNAIIFSPHPNAQRCSKRAVEIIKKAACEAGAPEGIIDSLELLTLQGTNELMQNRDVSLILATGGEGMVRAAYKSGTPTISGGPGNGPAFIDRTANVQKAVNDVIASKTFDNGVICASEQSIVIETCMYEQVRQALLNSGAYFMNEDESKRIGSLLMRPNGMINPETVGKTAKRLSEMAGFTVPDSTRVLISAQNTVARTNPYSREKLCPVLAFYVEESYTKARDRVLELLLNEGRGHTLVVHTQNQDIVREFALMQPVHRMLVNTPAALGGIGATTNLVPSLTLGCGALGGGSTSDNVGPMNLINVRKVGYGVRSLDDIKQSARTLLGQPQPQAQYAAPQAQYSAPQQTQYSTPLQACAIQEAPAVSMPAPASTPCYSGSIVDDTRFSGNPAPVSNNPTAYQASASQGSDARFSSVLNEPKVNGNGFDGITEENVSVIIKEVVDRLKG